MRISDWSSDVCSSDLGHHALVVRAGGKLAQVGLVDHAVADAVGHAPLEQRLQLRDPRLGQVQLADRLWAPREHRLHGVESVQAQFFIARTLRRGSRSEEHTSELQSLMRISYAVFCLKKKKDYNKLIKQR